jgi:hypothetical protein
MGYNKLAKLIHVNNVKKGFWKKKGDEGQRLFLVITELSEMCDADRVGHVCTPVRFLQMALISDPKVRLEYFVAHIKDTTGDELADAFIRMLDYCIGFKVGIAEARVASYTEINKRDKMKNLGAELLKLSGIINRIYEGKENKKMLSDYVLSRLIWIARQKKINLEQHIESKMWFNATRKKMHGKKY